MPVCFQWIVFKKHRIVAFCIRGIFVRIKYLAHFMRKTNDTPAFGLLLLLGLLPACLLAGNQVVINGNVRDAQDSKAPLYELMVVNLRTQNGFFGKGDGTFVTVAERTDTILIGATGYSTVKICFADSAQRDTFNIQVKLRKLQVQLKEVQIISPRDLEEIQKDIQKLGYNKKDYELSGVDAMSSPITFLYQQYNKLERLKRHNRERINEERKRQLLKELLHRYVDWEIIDLNDDEFDRFIDFCNVSEDLMKSSTQYDFIMYIKEKFYLFKAWEK